MARHATRAKSTHEGSDAEESESGALSGTSSEKQRLFETRAQLREAKQESLRLAGELAEDDEADEDEDDDYDDTHAPDEEDELATLRTANAALLRRLQQQRRTGAATKRSTWKPHSLHPMPPDTLSLLEPKDVLSVRNSVLQRLGVYSWVLLLGKAERKMLTPQELTTHEHRYQEFCDNYTANSLHLLHYDIYMALKRLLGKSLMVSHLFNQVTTETSSCASAFWDLLLKTFPPSSPQVVAGLIAATAGSIMRGPDHNSVDPDKAFKHWDAAVASLLQVGDAVMTPERLGVIMMYASLHSSTKDTYYNAFMRLNESLTHGTSTFDVATVRAAAVLAFNAENRRLKKTPPDSTPASVLGFAAAVGPRRSSTVSGSHTAGPGCCKCPFHCKLPDGTFRVVRARETDAAANVGTVATAPTSSESRHALQVYHAAVDDLETSAADIAFLRSIFETERQADFDRANPAAYAAFTGAAYIDFSDQD